jgi:hypothetical protein
MGRELAGRMRFGKQTLTGQLLLESSELLFRGQPRLRIPFKDILALEAKDGWLHVAWGQHEAAFELGAEAEAWSRKIKRPRGLMDKLGIKPDSRVAVVGLDDPGVLAQLEERIGKLPARTTLRERDVLLFGLTQRDELFRLPELRASLQPAGAIWAIWPKGRKELREDDVRAAARPAGLVDVKVASVSNTLSGLKLVIPVKDRGKKERQ